MMHTYTTYIPLLHLQRVYVVETPHAALDLGLANGGDAVVGVGLLSLVLDLADVLPHGPVPALQPRQTVYGM